MWDTTLSIQGSRVLISLIFSLQIVQDRVVVLGNGLTGFQTVRILALKLLHFLEHWPLEVPWWTKLVEHD